MINMINSDIDSANNYVKEIGKIFCKRLNVSK
jgi:hypothetical protein